MRNFASLSLEISIQLFFFPFLFFSYCSICPNVSVLLLTAVISLFFFAIFNVVFESSY